MTINTREDLTKLIKIECIKNGFTIDEIGRIMGMSSGNIHRSVGHSDMRLSTLQAIAEAMGSVLDITFSPKQTNI